MFVPTLLRATPAQVEALIQQALVPFDPTNHAAKHPSGGIVTLTERMRDDGVDMTTDLPPGTMPARPVFCWYGGPG